MARYYFFLKPNGKPELAMFSPVKSGRLKRSQPLHYMELTALAVKVGDKAPDFTLPSQKGEDFTLSHFFGKKNVVLYFYPKDETRGCTKEACEFRDKYEVFKDLGAEVIGVSSDDVESHESFAAKHNLPFILLSDKDKKVRKLYGVPSTYRFIPGRVTYIIDKSGTVRHIFSSQFQPKKHIQESIDILKKIEQ
jgi:peroxiredoxin Q/BCP